MSVEALNWAWKQTTTSRARDKLILIALADAAREDGVCWPKQATLAAKCDMSERSVKAAVSSLKDLGLLTVHKSGKLNVYQLAIGEESAPMSEEQGNTLAPVIGAESAPIEQIGENPAPIDEEQGQILPLIGADFAPDNRTQKEPKEQTSSFMGTSSDTPPRRVEEREQDTPDPPPPADEPPALIPPSRPTVTDWLPGWALAVLNASALDRLNLVWQGAIYAQGWTVEKASAAWRAQYPAMPGGLENAGGWVVATVHKFLRRPAPKELPRSSEAERKERHLAEQLARREQARAEATAKATAPPLSGALREQIDALKRGDYATARRLAKDLEGATV